MYRRYNTLCFLVNWSTLIEEEAGSGPSTVTLAAAVLLSNMSLNTAFLVLTVTHYWKSQFLSKNSILTKLYNFLGKSKLSTTKKCKSSTFSRDFHPNFFLTIFLVKSKLSTAKKSKTAAFSRVFT